MVLSPHARLTDLAERATDSRTPFPHSPAHRSSSSPFANETTNARRRRCPPSPSRQTILDSRSAKFLRPPSTVDVGSPSADARRCRPSTSSTRSAIILRRTASASDDSIRLAREGAFWSDGEEGWRGGRRWSGRTRCAELEPSEECQCPHELYHSLRYHRWSVSSLPLALPTA